MPLRAVQICLPLSVHDNLVLPALSTPESLPVLQVRGTAATTLQVQRAFHPPPSRPSSLDFYLRASQLSTGAEAEWLILCRVAMDRPLESLELIKAAMQELRDIHPGRLGSSFEPR